MIKISKKYKYIYVDSKYSIEFLKKNKVNLNNFILISFNPSLILDKKLDIVGLENNTSAEDFIKLGDIAYKYSGVIYKKIHKYYNDDMIGVWLARYLVSMQNTIYRVNKTKEFIKDDSCLFIKLTFKDYRKNNAINGNFYSYIKQYKNCEIFEIEYLKKDLNNIGRDPNTSFWIRLKYESIISILFRAICVFCKIFNRLWPYKIIYYSNENTLLKRAVFKLFLRGYFIKHFPKNLKLVASNIHIKKNAMKIFDSIKDILHSYQAAVIGSSFTQEAKDFYNNDILKYISSYLEAYATWKKAFLNNELQNVKGCVFGYPSTAMELSFSSLAKKNNLTTASFQHAISKEISKDAVSVDAIYESNIVKYYFVYNDNTALRSKHSRFHQSEDVKIGLPEDLKKGMNYKSINNIQNPILYATTNVYCGNRGIASRAGSSDQDKARFELDFIENILSKIPHRVQYKPYFSKRYVGDSIEINKAKLKKNIFVNCDEIDLRYITKKSRLIITSRATSTVGWCIFSSKPVIYIENVDNRLNEEASKIFKETLFFFDVLDLQWKKKLMKLLSKDLLSIESEWVAKQKATDNLIFKFLGYEKKYNDNIVLNKIMRRSK